MFEAGFALSRQGLKRITDLVRYLLEIAMAPYPNLYHGSTNLRS